MTYDVVIATRNRPRALKMSLPLIASQTIRPAHVIVVDASDDLDVVPSIVKSAFSHTGVRTSIVTSSVRSLPHQRNIGLDLVAAPIVMMPDDDSLWYATTAAEMLAIYALDEDHRVGGVTGRSTLSSPLNKADEVYERSRLHVFKQRLQPLRGSIEDRLFPQPFKVFAHELWSKQSFPDWIDGKRSAPVETVGGFRMSFRSGIIKAARFDELLGYKTGYAQHEDMEISLRLQKAGKLLVSAENAPVFHHVFPGRRANGFDYGFGQIANYIYICAKLMHRSSAAWSNIERYVWYKIQVYRLKRDDYGRSLYEGAQAAWLGRRTLMDASLDKLPGAFRALCDSVGTQNDML